MKAILHKLFPYAPYLNEYIGFEKDIPDNSTDEEALKAVEHLRELAEKSHADKYPYLYTESGKPITIEQVPDDLPQSKEQGLMDIIALCRSETALERFRPQVEALNNQGVTAEFENKLQSLKNQ